MFFFFFNEHADELRNAAENSKIKAIIECEDYYFQKALDKYEEYKNLDVDEALINALIGQTEAKPFSYEKLLGSYNQGTKEKKTLRVIGELISYIDQNAAMKNTLNEYADKRTMALAFVRQNVWVKCLLRFKQGASLEELPEVIQNAIRYIEHPDKVISIFKEQRKMQIYNTVFDGKDGDLFECMKEIGIKSKNPMNDGILYSVILHSEKIQELWNKGKDITPSVIKKQKTWSYAPGEDGYKWDEFKESGIMAIGWSEVGDLTAYSTKEEVKKQLNQLFGTESNHMNDGLALWQFCNEIQIGDRIFVKSGSKTLIGIGEVISDYEYNDSREEYKHLRKVNWIKVGRWELDEKFAIKTLTDISAFEEFCKKVELITSDLDVIIKQKWESYSKQDFLNDVFIIEEQYDTLTELIKRKKNIILQGAPGVGKTYAAKRLAYSIIGEKDENRVKLIQFHQSYSYEDFIMGYRPTDKGFSIKYGVFYNFCKQAQDNIDKPFFFIIDEINRGNLSKIFGELLMLIEADKRGEKMVLTYEETEFYVPDNVHIIGMMNTADRSLAIIDYALRRRFCFFELTPAFGTSTFKQYLVANNVDEAIIDKIVKRLSYLNNKIENDPNLGSGFRIGHSYFCDCNSSSSLWYENIIKYEVAPLLNEYWFDDLETAKNHTDELIK